MKHYKNAKVARNNEMRAMILSGYGYTSVARKFGLSTTCVRHIVFRECRKINLNLFDAGKLDSAFAQPTLVYLRKNLGVFGADLIMMKDL